MTIMQTLTATQANKETPINENFQTLSASAIFGKNQATTTGLAWGYYGGFYNGNTIADGTVTLTNAADNYVVVLRSTGVVSVSTSSTNSLDPLYAKLYKLTVAGSVVTAELDQRWDANGLLFNSSGLAGDMTLAGIQTVTGQKTFGTPGGAVGKLAVAGSTSGSTIIDAAAVAGSGTVVLPTSGTLATTADVAAAVAGLPWKQAVRAATAAALTLATDCENGDTIDGVALATGDRILIKNQASGTENGLYVVAASGAPTRATDADSGAELVNASVYVSEGTTLADTQWTCSTNAPITIGATNIAFAQLTSGGAVSDGDKGDITVSGSGTTWTIDNDAVSYAKLQNVSVTARLLARKSGGAGDVEETTLSELLDFVGSAAQGDILYRGAATWARLAAGTSGHFLKTQGAGADPVWAAASGGTSLTYAKISDSFTRPADTTAYVAGDAVMDSTSSPTMMEFTPAATAVGGYGRVRSATIYKSTAPGTKSDFFLYLFTTSPTAPNDNAALALSDADALKVVGVIYFPFTSAAMTPGANEMCQSGPVDLDYVCDGSLTKLYGLLTVASAGGYTPGNAEVFTIDLFTEQA